MYPVMGEKQMSKRVRWDQRLQHFKEIRTLHYIQERMGVTKRVFQVVYMYICVDVILVHIKTRLDLLGIQTFRWDQRLGRQHNSNLNRHVVSTQEKQSTRQYSTSSCMVL